MSQLQYKKKLVGIQAPSICSQFTGADTQLKTTVAKIDQLRKDIDAIVAEIEGEEQQA